MKVWVTMENEGVDYWGEIWDQMGVENVFAKEWEKQKVAWIPKPGKNSSMQKNKRGIMLQDGAGKAYLTWIQRTMAQEMKGTWKGYMYGGVKGRGTPHAMLRVYGVREHLRNNKIVSHVPERHQEGVRQSQPSQRPEAGQKAAQRQGTIPQIKKHDTKRLHSAQRLGTKS